MKAFFSSKKFWYGVLIFFALQSAWLALTARYPMAFDENYHYGLIKLHANQWLPWFTHQPAAAAEFGSVVRDPSYLYHYLLSLPYRLLKPLGDTPTILSLRFINIGLFMAGLLLMRRVLLRLQLSPAFTHVSLAMLTLIPVVPFLAATINYDNVFVPIFAAALLLTFTIFDDFAARHVSAARLLALGSLLLLGCLVKYPFLPVALVLGLSVVLRAWRTKLLNAKGWKKCIKSFAALPRWSKIGLTVRVLLSVIGARGAAGSLLASYLMFESDFTCEMIALGEADTLARREELLAFLGGSSADGDAAAPREGTDLSSAAGGK